VDHGRRGRRAGRLTRSLGRLSLAALLLGASAAGASAQTFEQVGVRAAGLGGAFVAVADDATATWWNPAGLASGAYFNAILEYDRADQPDATRAEAVSMALPSLGLSYYRFPISQMRPQTSTAGAPAGRQDQGVLSQYSATVGQSAGRHFVLATTLKLQHALDETHAGLDIGALATFSGVRVGFVVKNVTEPSFGRVDPVTLSRQVRTGLAITEGSQASAAQVTISADADLTRVTTVDGDERHVGGGLELWLARRRIGLRGGVSANTLGATRTSPSAGLSLALRSGTYLDGAWTTGSDPTRKGWGVDLRVTF
jgi:hypothetical protein